MAEKKARRDTVQISDVEAEGFMLTNGSYVMSLAQTAEAISLNCRNAFNVMRSKTPKSFMGKDSAGAISETKPEDSQVRGSGRVRTIPVQRVAVYWQRQSYKGHKQALSLCTALTFEEIEQRLTRPSMWSVQRQYEIND